MYVCMQVSMYLYTCNCDMYVCMYGMYGMYVW